MCYKELRPDNRTVKQNSTFAQHLVNNNHTMADRNNGLHLFHKGSNKLHSIEQFEIYKSLYKDDSKIWKKI